MADKVFEAPATKKIPNVLDGFSILCRLESPFMVHRVAPSAIYRPHPLHANSYMQVLSILMLPVLLLLQKFLAVFERCSFSGAIGKAAFCSIDENRKPSQRCVALASAIRHFASLVSLARLAVPELRCPLRDGFGALIWSLPPGLQARLDLVRMARFLRG